MLSGSARGTVLLQNESVSNVNEEVGTKGKEFRNRITEVEKVRQICC